MAAVLSLVTAVGAPQLVVHTPLLGLLTLTVMFTAGGYLAYLRLTPKGRRKIADEISADPMLAASSIVIIVGYATGGFAAASVLLHDQDIGALRGGEPEGATLATAVYWYYLWHLASSVPLLEIPRTLNWELRYAFTDHVHGALLLAYKLAVILPLLDLGRVAIAGWLQPRSNSRSRS